MQDVLYYALVRMYDYEQAYLPRRKSFFIGHAHMFIHEYSTSSSSLVMILLHGL